MLLSTHNQGTPMTIRTTTLRVLTASAVAFALAPAMAQMSQGAVKTDMPPIAGNEQLPAGTQNQTGGPLGETGILLPAPAPARPPVQVVQAPPPAPAPAPVAAPAPPPAPEPAPAPAPRVRADRG